MTDFESSCGNALVGGATGASVGGSVGAAVGAIGGPLTSALGATIGGAIGSVLGFFFDQSVHCWVYSFVFIDFLGGNYYD